MMPPMASRNRFRVPHTRVLLFGMSVLAVILTWLLPAGSFVDILLASAQFSGVAPNATRRAKASSC